MKVTRRTLFAICSGLLAAMVSAQSFAGGTVVNVKLWDKGPASMSMMGKGMMRGMGMMHGDGDGVSMGIHAAPSTIPAGKVTLDVTNVSNTFVHEMVISPVENTGQPLPYDASTQMVDEDAAGHLGEVAELDPGKSGALTLTLKPGKYILYCNVPGHYALGMWTLINVSSKPAS